MKIVFVDYFRVKHVLNMVANVVQTTANALIAT